MVGASSSSFFLQNGELRRGREFPYNEIEYRLGTMGTFIFMLVIFLRRGSQRFARVEEVYK